MRERTPCANCQPVKDEDGTLYYICVKNCVPRIYKPKPEEENNGQD